MWNLIDIDSKNVHMRKMQTFTFLFSSSLHRPAVFVVFLTWKIFLVGSLKIHLSVSLYEITFIEIERYP